MPANLTPQYRKAEENYRRAQTPAARVQGLEEMLRWLPRHKGTDRLHGSLRAKLKEAREELQAERKSGRSGKSHRIPRQGAGTVVLIGAPNSGKSRLLAELTGAQPEVAPYPFTTREPVAGMMAWEDIQIQLIDTPPIACQTLEPYLVDFIRSADLVVVCLDGSSDEAGQETLTVFQEITLRKTRLAEQSGFDPKDVSTVFVKTIGVATRGADPDFPVRMELFHQARQLPLPFEPFELSRPGDLVKLRNRIAGALEVIRVYTRKPGSDREDPDPITLRPGDCVEDLAKKIHDDLATTLRSAKVFQAGSHTGRTVGKDHILSDLDIVELYVT